MQMINEIETILVKGQSRKMAKSVVDLIINDESKINDLMNCFFSDQLRICQYAAWPVGILAEKHPTILLSYLPKMVANLDTPT